MFDPSMLDPATAAAMKNAGLTEVQDLNHNGKLDVQDVALMKAAASSAPVQVPLAQPAN